LFTRIETDGQAGPNAYSPFIEGVAGANVAALFWARTAGRDQGATTKLAPKEPARRSDAEIGRMDRPEPRDL
jgi:hypothetical protein